MLVIGGGGQLGSKIIEQGHLNFDMYATYMTRPPPLTRSRIYRIDKTDVEGIQKLISDLSPQVVVDTAAIHNVDYCEVHKEEARTVNVIGTKNVAEACRRCSAGMVFLSTDYVFDGAKGNYCEDDPVNPINYYGISKLEGERVVEANCDNHIIVRPSVIYGWLASSLSESSSGKPLNFAMWLTMKLQSKESVTIVTDQYSSPTLSDSLAQIILELCRTNAKGVYHVAGRTRLSRYEFAVAIARKMGLDHSLISPIETAHLKQMAARPMDSSLNVARVERTLGMTMPTVAEALEVFDKQASIGR